MYLTQLYCSAENIRRQFLILFQEKLHVVNVKTETLDINKNDILVKNSKKSKAKKIEIWLNMAEIIEVSFYYRRYTNTGWQIYYTEGDDLNDND